jgi:hypothetical protein
MRRDAPVAVKHRVVEPVNKVNILPVLLLLLIIIIIIINNPEPG